MQKSNIKNSRAVGMVSSLACGVAITALCLLLFSFIMTKFDASDGIVSAMSSIALCVGSYTASFLAASRQRKNGLLTGILCGVVVFVLTFLIGVVFMKVSLSMGVFSKLVMLLVCGAIGGIIGVNSKKRF